MPAGVLVLLHKQLEDVYFLGCWADGDVNSISTLAVVLALPQAAYICTAEEALGAGRAGWGTTEGGNSVSLEPAVTLSGSRALSRAALRLGGAGAGNHLGK